MKLIMHHFGQVGLNSFGGGESRWAVNWVEFVRHLGHEINFPPRSKKNVPFDLCLRADDDCSSVIDRPHVHLNFSPTNEGLLKIAPCYQRTGRITVACPYRSTFEQAQEWAAEKNVTSVFLPMPYPDHLLPGDLQPGFERREITWATKDMFNPRFVSPDSVQYYISQCALNTLKGIVKLSKKEKVDFKVNFLLNHCLKEAPPEYGINNLLMELPDFHMQGKTKWTDLVQIMGRTKLNVPVGGLCGSFLETLFTQGVPVLHSDEGFFPKCSGVAALPPPQVTTEEEIYDALERFWLDHRFYRRALECYQDSFIEHRTESLIKNFNETLERMGLA